MAVYTSVLTRAKLYAWKFMWGSFGLFLIMMITIRPVLTMPLARCVSALAGVVGSVTGAFTSYFKYGIIFYSYRSYTGDTADRF